MPYFLWLPDLSVWWKWKICTSKTSPISIIDFWYMFPDFYGTFELLSFAKVCPIFCGSLSSQFDRNEIRQKLAQFLLLISGIYSLIFMEPFINYLWKLFKFSTFQSLANIKTNHKNIIICYLRDSILLKCFFFEL